MENRIETQLEIFDQAYAKDRANSEENERAFEMIHRSIKKCLTIDPKKRPDFIQLFGENIRDTIEKGKIKFLISVKEKSIDKLENIDWEEAKMQEPVINPNPEVITQLKKDLSEKTQEIKQLREEKKKLAKENELLREENKKLIREKNEKELEKLLISIQPYKVNFK